MSDILFGQSYYLRFDPKLWEAMQPYPPLGTLYAASFMRERGYRVALFDAMLASSEGEWAAALDRECPRFAVIYEDNFNYLSKMCLLRMRQAAHTMIRMAHARGCTVIVCGSDATDHPDSYLAAGADFVLLGEGEATLAELLAALVTDDRGSTTKDRRARFEQIQGLAWAERSPEGERSSFVVRRSSRRPDIRDLDALPFPAWDLVDVERYRRIWLERHGYYSMNMVTTRGCPYHCNWCAKPIWGQRYNSRSPQNVVAELKWLKETYAPDHIWFADDIMGLKPGWMRRFGELVEAEGARVPFKCLSRVDLLCRPGEVEGLRRAGCRIVWVGAESGAQAVLDAMEKGTKVEQIYEATRRLHAAGVQVGFFLQFGYPGETRADIERTLQMVRDCRPDDIGMSVSYPLPGTPFYERVRDQLGVQQNWQDSSDLAMLYHGPFSTAFYRQLHVVLHREFRARKAWRELLRRDGRRSSAGRRLRLLLAAIKNALLLPPARLRLWRLERAPHTGLGPLPLARSHEAAATPSPQPE
ncbi:MAG TPA: radical SAM protein [Roseiflexaceae bacterium]|nr:radical SAM protein [Roseiflexaceae bacterium]